jgi:lysophospholipase-2
MLQSVASVDALIQAEVDAGIPEEKIIVGGFSQGGAVAILTALTTKRKLAGTVGLSCWVVLNHKIGEVCRYGTSGSTFRVEVEGLR